MRIRFTIVALTVLTALSSFAYDFEYTYEGVTINYTIVNDSRCCVAGGKASGFQSGTPKSQVTGNVIIPDSVEFKGKLYEVVYIDDYAFCYCENMSSLTIPSSIRTIFDFALIGCFNLKDLILEDSNRDIIIRSGNFEHLHLDSLYMGRNIEIGTYTSFPDGSPSKLTITQSVTTISEGLFAYSGISELSLPSSLKTIGKYAFSGCKKLKDVYYLADHLIEGNSNIFSSDIYQRATLCLSATGMEEYKHKGPWKNFLYVETCTSIAMDEIIAEFNTDSSIEIYDLKGVKVGDQISTLPAGFYIVRRGRNSQKIVVK